MSPSKPSGGSSSSLGRSQLVHGKREDVGRTGFPHVLLVVGAHGLLVDKQDGQLRLGMDPELFERKGRQPDQAGPSASRPDSLLISTVIGHRLASHARPARGAGAGGGAG